MSAPTAEEKSLISQFRARVADLCLKDDTDMYLIRWMRARDLNLNQAEEMLRKHHQFCKDNDIDSILTWEPPAILTSEYPVDIVGLDNENCPVGVLAFGKWDLKKCYEQGMRKEFVRYVDQIYFKVLDGMKGQVTSEGVPVTQFIVIYDMEGLSMKLLTCFGAMDMTMETLRRFEANHPETLKKAYVINASRIFSLLFAVVKPLLSQRTFGKVEVFDSNARKWKPILQKVVPSDVLPAKFGGKNYTSITNGSRDYSLQEDMTTTTVAAGGKHPVQLEVTDCNTVLSWSFLTANHDIGFSVSCENEELVKYGRIDAKRKAQEGSVICHKPGTYTLLFDNSYSRMRAKDIMYKVSLGSS